MHAVELLPDEPLDQAVRAAWQHLAAHGLPSLAAHPHPTNRPHLTLATSSEPPNAAVAAALTGLPVPARITGLVFFGGRTAMAAWRLAPDPALTDLQAAVWAALAGTERNPLHDPARWVPHLSLARRVRDGQRPDMTQALDGLGSVEGLLITPRYYDSGTRTVSSPTDYPTAPDRPTDSPKPAPH